MVTNSQTAAYAESLRPSNDELALDRSRLVCERTMTAWIRTSASMISFGFGIYKFLDYFKGERPVTQGIVSPRYFATFLIDTGLFALTGVAAEPGRSFAVYAGRVPRSLAGAVAVLMSIIGTLALVATIMRQRILRCIFPSKEGQRNTKPTY
jgi:putative membrane protein